MDVKERLSCGDMVVFGEGKKVMKERPILFNGEMVRAILDGRKTQTRRVIKPQPEPIPDDVWQGGNDNGWWWRGPGCGTMISVPQMNGSGPYGVPGDRLWVRETFRVHHLIDVGSAEFDDGSAVQYKDLTWNADNTMPTHFQWGKWRPSIHMPRWASRIDLLILDIKVERLQDITVSDACDEGVPHPGIILAEHTDVHKRVLNNFRELWDSINEKREFGWDVNPWVWVVRFERIK